MATTDPKTDVQATSSPIFVPKSEAKVEISIDDALARIKELRAQMEPFEKMEKNLIEVVKASMALKGVTKYTSPVGDVGIWSESQETHINKELAKELLGEAWHRVHSFKTKRKFTVK